MSTAFSRRFQLIVDQLSLGNKKNFAELTGKSASHIYKICRGASRPSMAYLQGLYEEYNVDLHWLLTGEKSGADHVVGELKNRELVHAPMFDVQASAGLGLEVSNEHVEEYFSFTKAFLSSELGISGEQLAFVSIRGESMLPTLHDGDRVLVDMSQRLVNREGVYLLQSEDGLMAKRLKDNKGDLYVTSDNPDFKSWVIEKENRDSAPVMGKVVWCARSF